MYELKSREGKVTTENLDEIKALATSLLVASEEATEVEAKKVIEEDLEEVINYYGAVSKKNCYNAAKASDDAMKFAVIEFFYPTIRVKEVIDKDTKVVIREIVEATKPIDLGDLHKKLEGIGANPSWIHAVEKFNLELSKKAADDLNIKNFNVDNFHMHKLSREIEMGKNPCGTRNLISTLQGIVDMMLGEGFKVEPYDVNYLVSVYASDDKKSKTSVTLANHKTLRGYLKKVCYRLLTGATSYDVVQKEIKNKTR